MSRNGNVVFDNGYGMANLEHDIPITPASIFHVASVSKQFTATAVMLLARDGKLSLDDNVRKHVPEVPAYPQRINRSEGNGVERNAVRGDPGATTRFSITRWERRQDRNDWRAS